MDSDGASPAVRVSRSQLPFWTSATSSCGAVSTWATAFIMFGIPLSTMVASLHEEVDVDVRFRLPLPAGAVVGLGIEVALAP